MAKLEGVDKDGESIWHTVLVDSARRLVFDGCQEHALRLCSDTFDACVGDDFSFIGGRRGSTLQHSESRKTPRAESTYAQGQTESEENGPARHTFI